MSFLVISLYVHSHLSFFNISSNGVAMVALPPERASPKAWCTPKAVLVNVVLATTDRHNHEFLDNGVA